jgi:hypothetical protein
MRPPKFRLRTMMIVVAVAGLVLGAALEYRHYRIWVQVGHVSRVQFEIADNYDRIAANQRETGGAKSAKATADVASELRQSGRDLAAKRRQMSRPWYRFLNDPGKSDW